MAICVDKGSPAKGCPVDAGATVVPWSVAPGCTAVLPVLGTMGFWLDGVCPWVAERGLSSSVGDRDLERILSRLGMRASLDGIVPRDTLSTSVTSRPPLDEVALSLRDGPLGFPSTLTTRLAPSCC